MKYLIELHCHSSETSSCSKVGGSQLADMYKARNYHAITIMDHYFKGFFNKLGDVSWQEKTNIFLSGYRNAKKRGGEIGLNVILGIELRFHDNFNDYLIFGIDEQFLYNNPELYNYSAKDFSEFAKDNNLLFIQAHPFRNRMVIINHDLLDGIEVYNAHPSHNSRNYLAELAHEKQSEKRRFIATAGSDCHHPGHEGNAGIISGTLPSDSIELASVLMEQKYELYKFQG